MRNLTLSNGVKKYFVHALKSLGLRSDALQPELSEAEIERLLVDPNTDSTQILSYIKEALLAQLENDRRGDQYLRRNTAFDRKAAESLLEHVNVNGLSMDATQRRECLQLITKYAQNSNTIEMVILTLGLGLNDQNLNNFEKDEAQAFWDEIRYADFKAWLNSINEYRANEFNNWLLQERSGQGDPQSNYSCLLKKYRIKNVENKLERMVNFVLGPNVDVKSFLDTKIPTSDEALATWGNLNTKDDAEIMWHKIKANESLFQSSIAFCEQRCKLEGKDPKTEFSIKDVLATAGNSNEQLITFFQTRSKDQKIQQKNDPKNSGMTKENKIGNVMGKTGRKCVEKINGGIGAAVEFDKELGMKKGRMGPWRGLQPLLEQISTFFKEVLYKYMPIIGFVQGMMESLGYASFDPKEANTVHEEEDLTQAWQTEYKPIPNACKDENGELNVAGEFVNRLKARLLNDRMQLAEYTMKLENFETDAYDPRLEKAGNIKEYLEQRIKAAEEIYYGKTNSDGTLIKGKMPKPDSPAFNNPQYFAELEKQILNQKAKDKDGVDVVLNFNTDQNANVFMISALRKFEKMANAKVSTAQQGIKREMAADVFNLGEKYKNGEISGADLDNMTDRFIHSTVFVHMLNELHELSPQGKQKIEASKEFGAPKPVLDSSKDYEYKVETAVSEINDFVQKDLIQYAKYNEHKQHWINHYCKQFGQEASMER